MNERQATLSSRSNLAPSVTLREKVDSLIRALERWADRLDRQRYSYDRRGMFNETKHWKTRGSQKTLCWVAKQLKAMRNQHKTDYALYKCLVEYLECLRTGVDDANEEVQDLRKRKWALVERWKAEGEAYVLPHICTKLSRLVSNHIPEDDTHTLSLDGRSIVSFPESEDEPAPVENARLPLVFNRDEYAMLMAQAPRQSQETEQVDALFPTPHSVVSEIVRRLNPVKAPLLGPFPLVPDDISEYHQEALTGIESALANYRSLLVKLAPEQDNTGVFLACLDRLLQYTYVSRVLVVPARAALKPELVRAYNSWVSYEDEASLSERYPAQTSLKGAITSCVSIASIREMQMAMQRAEPLPRDTFDVLVLYGYPFISHLWQTVLEYFTVPCRIGFSEALDDELAAQFDHHIVFAVPVGTETSASATSMLIVPPHPMTGQSQVVEALLPFGDRVGADRECQVANQLLVDQEAR